MLIHRRHKTRYEIQAPLTSLIDIIFMLLIYFLLTTNFMTDEGISIKLPQAKATVPQVEEDITIYIDKDGQAFLKNELIPHERLFTDLKELISGRPDSLVMVKADRSVILDKAVRVMDIAKEAGASKLILATEKDF